VLHYIGSYHLRLGGQVDALVFSGGIGERSDYLRSFIGDKVQCLGYVGVDPTKNAAKASDQEEIVLDIGLDVGNSTSGHRMLVVHTDEQVHFLVYLQSEGPADIQ
jgi:acetate kinase